MHPSVEIWVGEKVEQLQLHKKSVLEVGSLNVNGTVRGLFSGAYFGIDMQSGKGVDLVCNAHKMPFNTGLFEVVVSTEMLEHDDMFWLSVAEMGRVLKMGGFLILTARGNGFPEHCFPNDHFRFMPSSFEMLLDLAGCSIVEIAADPDPSSPGVFGIGKKYKQEMK